MPTAEEYSEGFEIYNGLQLAGYELVEWTIEPRQIIRFNEYSYSTVLVFYGTGNISELVTTVQKYTTGLRVIYSQSGRPYKCVFQWSSNEEPKVEVFEDQVFLHFSGYAKRIGKKEAMAINEGYQTEW